MNDFRKKDIEKIEEDLKSITRSLNLEQKREKLQKLQEQTSTNHFWEDAKNAKNVMSNISFLEKEISTIDTLQKELNSLKEITKSATEQEKILLSEEFLILKEKIEKFSFRKFLSNKYDSSKALLTINAGQGGTESNDWAQILLRMYSMYFEKEGWNYKVTNLLKGNEAGITTASIEIEEPYSFGILKKEHGVHRLVRVSPFNAQGLRQTTFAGVEVLPIFEENDQELHIPEKDIRFKAVKAGGPGGQNVNKTSSAVQLTHIPTGITAHSSELKSQLQNRQKAMEILKAKLWRIKEEKKLKKIDEVKGDFKEASWGNQIRNYVLHPYKLVKDLRTNVQSNDPESVLDGDIEKFLEAQIRIE